MPALSSELRNKLAAAVKDAREVGERGAEAALVALEVGDKEARGGMADDQRKLRVRLRAHGRQLGDVRQANGIQSTTRLKREIAYQHWHRMLFGRFLAENNLLMHPEHGVALSINDCRNLAEEEGRDLWEMVGSFAQGCLPQIFRQDDPALAVKLAPEHLLDLEALLGGLPSDVFTADDSLGWVYQFWQAEEKDRVNKSEVPIGADELPAVTQLFTEHYMVQFLLHNTLGAWHAAKVLEANPDLAKDAENEQELRDAVALPNYKWDYLRFVRDSDEGPWRPAGGTFAEWPRKARDLKTLDPCCGSGHFLVELFAILLALREYEEGRPRLDLIREVLRHNLSGLELDPRCTQIAAFALALAAWKAAGEVLPDLHINVACSGISVGDDRETWLKLAGKDRAARETMDSLFDLFRQAPLLGSLIDPARTTGEFFGKGFSAVRELVEKAVRTTGDDDQREAGIAAVHVAEAVRILTDRYHLVATNVPYLKGGSQDIALKDFCEAHFPIAKYDLAAVFVMRCIDFLASGGHQAVVTQQYWLFLKYYEGMRAKVIRTVQIELVGRLGPNAFEQISGEVVNVCLQIIGRVKPREHHQIELVEVDQLSSPEDKASGLATEPISPIDQRQQLQNPDARIMSGGSDVGATRLSELADFGKGSVTGDGPKYLRRFWEFDRLLAHCKLWLNSPPASGAWTGRSQLILWRDGVFNPEQEKGFALRGDRVFGKRGVAIGKAGSLRPTLYLGEYFDDNLAVIQPANPKDIPAVYMYVNSDEFRESLKALDKKMSVTAGTFTKVPIDIQFWRQLARDQYPHGLPEPQSNDPTQWLFHGHPAGMVAAGPASRSPFGVADPEGADRHASLICREPNPADVLQVAVARLLGYRWPAELDDKMQLDEAQRDWVERCADLAEHADADGIVCFDRLRGEDSASERIVRLLRAAFGAHWTDSTLRQLIKATGSKATTVDGWLRRDFFAQHCKSFLNSPFIWHIWDGLPDGFNALVNYHKLAGPSGEGQRTITTLTFTYLNDWIDRQRNAVKADEDGADERLACALELQEQLKSIIEGEPYYDIFVRWKPLHKQPIGWKPDINDGVRINIRPFMKAKLRRGKSGAGILRSKPKVSWGPKADRGGSADGTQSSFPWLWKWEGQTKDFPGGEEFDGKRWNDLHYSREFKQAARDRHEGTA